jgi:myosin heavy subunit
MKSSQPSEGKINTSWMIPGRRCWVEMPQKPGIDKGFEHGNIAHLNESQEMVLIKYKIPKENLPEEVHISKIFEVNDTIPEKGLDDMVNMNCLNEAELLHNIELRYAQNIIYTYIGPTLLFMNPYKPVPAIFSKEILDAFAKRVESKDSFNLKDMMPNVYAISAKAYKQLFENKKNQAIVISGESGAGKTENAKYAMKFLTSFGSSDDGHRTLH